LVIHNTGFSYINTAHDSFYLNKFSHCPKAATNLLSINQFFLNNDCYFIMTETDFYVKENKTRWLMLHGLVEDALYLINKNKSWADKFCCLTSKLGIKAIRDQWHDRLCHPSKSTLVYAIDKRVHQQIKCLSFMFVRKS
jgi:hypothetical protein